MLKKISKLVASLLFLLSLNLNLRAIDELLLEELQTLVPDVTVPNATAGAVPAATKTIEDGDSDSSGSSRDGVSTGSHSTYTRLALAIDMSEIVNKHLRDSSTVSGDSVGDRAAERAGELMPDLTRSAPTVPSRSPAGDLELSLLGGGFREYLDGSSAGGRADGSGSDGAGADSSIEVGDMGSLVSWQARLTPRSTHTNDRGATRVGEFTGIHRRTNSEVARNNAAIVSLLADTITSGHAFIRSGYSGSADGSGPRDRS